jgi:protein-S-isoprenylcysteine O-methyltransferase Ste14
VLAVLLTAYCLLAPLLKERRFAARYGERFMAYRARVPYAMPRWRREVSRAKKAPFDVR